ncbi:MAG: PTS sugar transporter subunit IIA [Candidatus Nanohaloarchaea archaeon]|nr:PTS sugar transporter subunit IIA [Candidatus Nanohaloarchaea archaeon]
MDPDYFDSLISPDLIELDQDFQDKDDCIQYLIGLVYQAGRLNDRQQVHNDIMAREEQTNTGVGKGIGIPHAKTSGVDEPTVAFVRAEDGVDFGAMDDSLAHLIFMLLVPEGSSDEHLKLLSTLSRALVHDEVREALMDAATPDDVIDTLKEAVSE